MARSIEKGDMDATSHFKSRIENAQRALRKKEQEEKREWERVFFSQANSNTEPEKIFQSLVQKISGFGVNSWEGVAPDKTAGIWRYDENKAQSAKKPFHSEGLLALGENSDGSSAPVSRVTTNQSGI